MELQNRKSFIPSCSLSLAWFEDEVGRSPSHQPGPHSLSFVHGHEDGRALVLDE
jgi:hypothetical protein